nr:uncharacterized protein LOC105324660 isoform X2 [Crassostrea gigas]
MVCRFCNKSSKHLKRCIGCLQVSYCSKECQKEDWSQRHQVECKVAKPLELNMICQTTKSEGKEEKEELKPYKRHNKEEDGKRIELLDCCFVCGSNGELKTCQECHKARYCSRECQKADWKTHKTDCKKEEGGIENHKEQDNETLSICAHCRVKGTHNACEYCSAVFYCSETCQRLDWGRHKTTCKLRTGKTNIPETLTVEQCTLFGLVTPEENNGVDPNDVNVQIGDKELLKGPRFFCNRCKDHPSILTCPNCNSATYCSVLCCDQDKDDHKETCRTIQSQKFQEGPSPFPSSTRLGFIGDTSDKINYLSVNHSPSHSVLPFLQDPLYVQDNADLTLVIERSATSCERAREKIKRKFPNYILITRVREIPMEKISVFGSNICTQPFVFLSYIRRFHGYRGRHNVYLQDSERREIYVSFYLPNDDPLPHFRWSDVVPGKFIAILIPCIHLFRDGSVGLRVDKATNAYIFNVKD